MLNSIIKIIKCLKLHFFHCCIVWYVEFEKISTKNGKNV